MTDPIALRNRFAMVKGAWDEHLRGVPFPALGEGTAEEKIERLELALVDEMHRRATPETAECVRAPPSSSFVTSSWVTVRSTSGPVTNI